MKKSNLSKLKGSLMLLAFLLIPLFTNAQKEPNIIEVLDSKKSEFERMGYSDEKIQKKIGKYTRYWQDRLNEKGQLGKMEAAFQNTEGDSRANGFTCTTDDADWNCIGPFSYKGLMNMPQWTGFVQEVYVPDDKSYVVIGSERGGIWKKMSTATYWDNVTDQMNIPILQISSIVANPFNQHHLFASCGGNAAKGYGILESTNGGTSWSVLQGFSLEYCDALNYPGDCSSGNENFINVTKLIVDPHSSTNSSNVTLYALTSTGNNKADIWQSTDSGVNWMRFTDPILPIHDVWSEIEVDDQGHLFCATRSPYGISARYYRYDPLATSNPWQNLTDSIQDGNLAIKDIRFTIPHGNLVYALRDDTTSTGDLRRNVLESTDFGLNWAVVHTSLPISPKLEIEYSPTVDSVFIGGVHLRGIDPNIVGSSHPSLHQGHVDIRDIFLHESSSGLTIYTANDGGVSSRDFSTGAVEYLNDKSLPLLQFFDIGTAQISEDRFIGGTTHNYSHAFNNGSWEQVGSGDGNSSVINYDNPDLAYITANQYVYRYSFANGTSPLIPSDNSAYYGGNNIVGSKVYLNPVDPNLMYYINDKDTTTGNNYLNVWNEASDKWQNRLVPFLKRPGELGIAKKDTNRMYIAENSSSSGAANVNKFLRSDNAGVSWISKGNGQVFDLNANVLDTLSRALSWKRITDIEVNPYNKNQLWISISGYVKTDEEYRVLQSNDGGDTWVEYSQGLPRYPVHSIVYVEATNGLMFAGTEAGVFYRDNSMSQWECFNNGMAYAQIMDLDINYCTFELIAGTYGRSMWKTKIPSNLSPLVYSTNTTFSSANPIKINTDILVQAPAVFRINSDVEMAFNRNIIVEPGATLVIDGATVTNQCDKLWGGIKLGGNSNMPQLSDANLVDPNQATLFMINGATIQHSRYGVTTKAYDYGFGHGARIFATKSKFIDNRFDVEMLSYLPANVSYFKHTDFITTGPLPDPAYVDVNNRLLGTATHVRLWGINGVEFFHNRFINTGSFDQDLRGTGIFSLDADFTVYGKCNAYNQWNCVDPDLSFQNLSRGIVFNSTLNNNQLRVNNNLFENVVQGIFVNGGTNIFIDDNHFLDYGGSNAFGGIDFMESWGAYLLGTEGALISDNLFRDNNSGGSPLELFSRGVISQSTNGFDTDIMRNVFDEGDMVGVQGWANNDDLQIWCNDFHSEYGIYISRLPNTLTFSTLPSQGTMNQPAGNMFFHNCTDNESHIYFDGINPLNINCQAELEYNDYLGMPNGPVCNSNDIDCAPLPSPGYVTVIPQGDYKDGVCDPQEGSEGGENRIGRVERQGEMVEFIGFIESINADNRDFLSLNAKEIARLEQLAEIKSAEGSKALAILDFIGKQEHIPYVLEIDPVESMRNRKVDITSEIINLYPNPADDKITISISEISRKVSFEVYDMVGRSVFQMKGERNSIIDVSDWQSGVYTVVVQLDDRRETLKFVVN